MSGKNIEPHMVPVNGDAARVVYGEMVHFEPNHYFGNAFTIMPDLLRDQVVLKKMLRDPNTRRVLSSRLNKKFGRITVLGLALEQGSRHRRRAKGMKYVCRCDCGMFCRLRNRTFIEEIEPKCGRCSYNEFLRFSERGQSFLQYLDEIRHPRKQGK